MMTGSGLAQWRKDRNLIQNDLALIFDVGRTTVVRWEQSEIIPTVVEYACKGYDAGVNTFASDLALAKRRLREIARLSEPYIQK